MKLEFSAGGVVYRPDTGEILVVQHSKHHHWSFPKGHIGDTIKGETKEEAALREVEEETGVTAEIRHSLPDQTYWYQFEGEKRKKTVYYFLMEYLSGDIGKGSHDFEMEKVEWLTPVYVEERLTYPGDKKVWREAQDILKKITS